MSARDAAFTIRDAADDDLAAIARIYEHHVRTGLGSFEEEAPSVAELARRRADVLAKGLPYLVATGGGGLFGYAYASPYRARSAYRFSVEDSIYVTPGDAGRGVGRAPAGGADHPLHRGRLSPDGRGDRRQRQCRLDRRA
jgi:phosphinothricin acetyltransferase